MPNPSLRRRATPEEALRLAASAPDYQFLD